MRTIEDLPSEIIRLIISSVRRPYDHLAFSRSCSSVARAYTSKNYQGLCFKYGIGRPVSLQTKYSWRGIFELVMQHVTKCTTAACVTYGVPPPDECWQRKNGQGTIFPAASVSRKIHRQLTELGVIGLDSFLAQNIVPFPTIAVSDQPLFDQGGHREEDHRNGCDWQADDGRFESTESSYTQHPIAFMAFACQPPTDKIVVLMDIRHRPSGVPLKFTVTNKDGVTVLDIITTLKGWMGGKITAADRKIIARQLEKDQESWFNIDTEPDSFETYRKYFDDCEGDHNVAKGYDEFWILGVAGLRNAKPIANKVAIQFVMQWRADPSEFM